MKIPDDEILRAISYGLVPKELQDDYDKSVTYAEFCGMNKMVVLK